MTGPASRAGDRGAVRVGLVLGNEVGFPRALEDLLAFLAPALVRHLDGLRIELVRVPLAPFDLAAPAGFDLLLDRVSHYHVFAREWLKTAALDGAYVINHPFQFQALEKAAGFAALARLGLDVPRTLLLPPKDQTGLPPGVAERSHLPFDLAALGEQLGYPLFLKPFDGGGWIGVSRPEDAAELHRQYDLSGRRVMLLQEAVEGARFVRCMAVGPQVRAVPYAPGLPLHERYLVEPGFLSRAEEERVAGLVRLIDAFQGLEWNTVELMIRGERIQPIDFWNGVPDASPSSLHHHFPWTLAALVRWILFGLVTRRRFRFSTRMARYLEIAREEPSPAARGAAYDELVAAYFSRAAFERFRRERLGWLDAAMAEWLESPGFAAVLEEEVRRVYPPHEHAWFLGYLRERMEGAPLGP